jgi:hypothetical protein
MQLYAKLMFYQTGDFNASFQRLGWSEIEYVFYEIFYFPTFIHVPDIAEEGQTLSSPN